MWCPGQAAVWTGGEEKGAEEAERGGYLDATRGQSKTSRDTGCKIQLFYIKMVVNNNP